MTRGLLPGPTLPNNPSITPGIPGVTGRECDTYTVDKESLVGGKLSVAVVCIPRIIEKNQYYSMGVIVRGGQPPYALNIDWGSDEADRLRSILKSGYEKISFRYGVSGAFNITLNLTDSKGNMTKVETAIQVNGEKTPIITTITDAIAPSQWFTSPVPLYVVAVAVTLGFWGGEIFVRRFGSLKTHSKNRHRRV